MKIVNCKLKIDERGEIATALTLISIGLMLLGVVAGKVAVQQTTNTQSKAESADAPTACDNTQKGIVCANPDAPLVKDCKLTIPAKYALGCNTDQACFDCRETLICDNTQKGIVCAKSDAKIVSDCKQIIPPPANGCQTDQACYDCSAALPSPTPPTTTTSCTGSCRDTGACFDNEDKRTDLTCGQKGDVCCVPKTTTVSPTLTPVPPPPTGPTPTYAPGIFTCSSNCKSNSDGTPNICYNECAPDAPGYSRTVKCSSNGWDVGFLQPDPACGQANGTPAPSGSACTDGSVQYPQGSTKDYCVNVGWDGKEWVSIDRKCLDGRFVLYPGGILPNPANPATNPNSPPKCPDGRPVPTEAAPQPTASPNTGGSQYCFPYECPDGSTNPDSTKKQFSVQNRKLYNSADCSGNPATSYSAICNTLDACDLVSGGSGKGICVADKKYCPESGHTGNAYPRWGPAKNDVDIPLCTANKNLCCEPDNGPNRGFLPKALPTIYLTPAPTQPSSGNSTFNGTSCSVSYPNNIVKDTPFKISVTSALHNMATGVNLVFNKNGNITTIPADGSDIWHDGKAPGTPGYSDTSYTTTTWNFKNIKLDVGVYKVSMTFNIDNGVTDCGQTIDITVQAASAASSAAPIPTLTSTSSIINSCKDVTDLLAVQCSTCVDSILKVSQVGNYKPDSSCSPSQNVLYFCKKKGCYGELGTCTAITKQCDLGQAPKFWSFSNTEYDTVANEINLGRLDAMDASVYVTAATRTPGLQHQFCEPKLETAPGGCTFGTPASSQTQT